MLEGRWGACVWNRVVEFGVKLEGKAGKGVWGPCCRGLWDRPVLTI